MRLNRFKREFACNARKLCSEVAQSPLYLRSDEGLIVNARNIRFRNSLRWKVYIITSVVPAPPTQHHYFYRNLPL